MASKASNKPANVTRKGGAAKPVLLAGGNPQIPKGDGDAPVQAYIAAMPGWKREIGRNLDIHEDEELDDAQLAAWVERASQLPGDHL